MNSGSSPREEASRAALRLSKTFFCTKGWRSSEIFCSSLMFIERSSCASVNVTGVLVSDLTNVLIGGVAFCPLNPVRGAKWPLDGDGVLFNALWTSGKRSDQCSGRSWSSDSTARNVRTNSILSLSTSLLLHRQYGSVKWWGVLRTSEIRRTFLFLKCVSPSRMSPLETQNAAGQ